MKTNYLFPVIFKKIGWFLFVPFFISCIYCLFGNGADLLPFKVFALVCNTHFMDIGFCKVIENCVFDELSVIGLTVSLLFIAFSKEKDEDECIAELRMRSLVWAIIVNYSLLIAVTLFVYGTFYLTFAFINLFTMLFLFIIKFNIALYKFRRTNNE